jgi:hypothetical protein
MMVAVTGDVVRADKAVEFVADLVHSALAVVSTFGFEGWDLHIP